MKNGCSIVILSGCMDDVPIRCFDSKDEAVRWANLTFTSPRQCDIEAHRVLNLLSVDVSEWVAAKVVTFGPTGEVVEVTACHAACGVLENQDAPGLRLAGDEAGGVA